MTYVPRIQPLPDLVANQIAAGEVIERPASVVKELLENALDAQAQTISIDIHAGGLSLIRISDNGHGVVSEDLPLVIAAHATSKIRQLSDLAEITSMGFRGEALASIASISKISICSKTSDAPFATLLTMNGSEIILNPSARSQGTTIEVRDLFFNAPVRKKFLKSERLEYLAIEAVVKRFALSAPQIAIHLKHNDKKIFSLPAAECERSNLSRVQKIMGKEFMVESIALDVERLGMSLRGFISSPSYMRSQNDKQWIYVNQRMVKDKFLTQAFRMAYDDLIYPGRYPACLLYLSLPPHEVDVNVHPAKHEVRFEQPRLVHDFIISQLSQALTEFKAAPITKPIKNRSVDAWIPELSREWVSQSPWVIVNTHFVMLKHQSSTYLIHIFRLRWLKMQVGLTFPLATRALLVPVQFTLGEETILAIQKLMPVLSELGFKVQILNAAVCQILSTPMLFPALDIQQFLQSLANLTQDPELSYILWLMATYESFDVAHLTLEEQINLEQYARDLLDVPHQSYDWCMELNTNKCQELLHA